MPITLDGTKGIAPATWTTAERPTEPVDGQMGSNTTTGLPEWYSAAQDAWINFNGAPDKYEVEYLVIGGGGGGGNTNGGGGGAGGYRTSVSGETSGSGAAAEPVLALKSGRSAVVIVGAGGPGFQNGGDSSFLDVVSIGGGRGGTRGNSGGGGGSGGGQTGRDSGGTVPGTGTLGQGTNGGTAFESGTTFRQPGGGGGALIAGGNATSAVTGAGGAGISSSITGTSVGRGGGGSAAGNASSTDGGGGAGVAGAVNTGGGGGGGNVGGSGIVVIRYLGAQRGTGGTVTSAGGFTIHTFTSSEIYTA